MVITPNATDYDNLKSMVNAKGFDLAKLKAEWFPQGKPGSLFEQDILNVYFRFRNRLFPDGYNVSPLARMSHRLNFDTAALRSHG